MTRKNSLVSILIACAVAAIIAVFSCGCTSQNNNGQNTVTDTAGRTVSVPSKVSTIASVGSGARIATYAGCADKLVAVTEMEKTNVARPYTIANKQLFENLPTTSNGNHMNSTTVDEERLLQIKPDIIISSRSKDECDKLQADTNIPVVCVYSDDKLFGDSIQNAIEVCGKACGTTEHAAQTVDYLNKCKDELTELATGLSLPTLYRGAINYKGTKGFTGTISKYSVYEAIGAKNVADRDDISTGYDTTMEQILSWNAPYIFVDCTNEAKVREDYANNTAAFKALSAYQNGKIFEVGPYNMNGTNYEYGLCEAYFTLKTIAGDNDKVKSLDLDKKFSEIFTKMLGADCYGQLKSAGLKFNTLTLS